MKYKVSIILDAPDYEKLSDQLYEMLQAHFDIIEVVKIDKK